MQTIIVTVNYRAKKLQIDDKESNDFKGIVSTKGVIVVLSELLAAAIKLSP